VTRPAHLDVYLGADLIARLHDSSPASFEYLPQWLDRPDARALGPLALQPGPQQGEQVDAVFENLLPEGELRAYLSEQRKAVSLFSLLLEVAGDTAGGIVLLPAGQQPQAPAYEKTSWPELARRIQDSSAAAIDIKGQGARISLAGAQDKTSVALLDGDVFLPRGTSPSTHIVKPDIRRLAKVWASAANEVLCMRLAHHCGLSVADVFYESATRSCVVTRFDRVRHDDGSLERVVQFDLCQLAATPSERKYEKEGGPGAVRCAELIRQYSTRPAVDLRRYVEWIFFNLYCGNNDGHAKNLSMYWLANAGAQLTPFYDLMCTRIYPGLSQEFAFSLVGEVMPGQVGAQHIRQFAEALRMRPSYVLQMGAELAERVPLALDKALADIIPNVPAGDLTMARRMADFILSTTRKTAARLALRTGEAPPLGTEH